MKTMKTMKTIQALAIVVLFIGFTTSCDSDDDVTQAAVESKTVSNLHAPQTGGAGPGQGTIGGDFTKFDFVTGEITTSETEWDIAFRGLRIAVNGGVTTGTADEPVRNGNAAATIFTGTLGGLTTAEGLVFDQDGDTGYAIPGVNQQGWYDYNFMTNIVLPIPGRVLVFRTRDGRYAKVEILSYYRDNPTEEEINLFSNVEKISEARFYSFNFVYNPNEGDTTF
jgi:hypothetical protein